ncbi:NAD(P)/FAD-dependent oxidoreductase [Pseudonocardia zijingensis]|uniref:NAD(P)/FAD-dependent oxidoreductase n=1 Tax=Pseudonocardia zijingensis TaxID=153376 RepID=A0ABP3ZKK5_9PSEU
MTRTVTIAEDAAENPGRSPARRRVEAWLADFEAALAARDATRAAALFAPACFWRDLVSFTWNLVTVEDRDGVADLLRATMDGTDARDFHVTEEPTTAGEVVEAWIGFRASAGRGRGHLRLTDEGAWTLLTTLHELTGHEEPMGERRPAGAEHGVRRDRVTWAESRRAESEGFGRTHQPYVVVIGGGQAGITLGARLRQLGVPHVVVDRYARPGDQWRSRYKSLCLHDPVWYDHLPYLDFPRNWPVYTPKDKIADWLEMYTTVMEVTYWSSTTCTTASFDERAQEWSVVLDRDGEQVTLRPRHLVLATGVSGKPDIPVLPGQDTFAGEQQHSSQHPGPDAYRGRKVVVIGSNNSAFDICGALWEVGADVTMVQRSSTLIARSESLMEFALAGLYSEQALAAGITTEKADLTFASLPYRILPSFQQPIYTAIRERDREYYDRLAAAGFWLDWGEDDSGLFMKYLRRGSGYYIDVGAADLVARGDVKLAHGQVSELDEDAVVLADGTRLEADLVVYATGYGSMTGWAADLIGPEVADRVGKVWGLGSGTAKDPGPWEGELRNMWKPTRQDGLWFHGGNLHQCRHYSQYLALQLKARFEGIPTPVHGVPDVHHTR